MDVQFSKFKILAYFNTYHAGHYVCRLLKACGQPAGNNLRATSGKQTPKLIPMLAVKQIKISQTPTLSAF